MNRFYLPLTVLFFVFGQLQGQNVDFSYTQVCFGEYTTLSGQSSYNDTSVTQWYWDLDNDGLFDEDSGKQITYTYPVADTSLTGLRIVLNSGGADTVVHQVVVNPVPDVNFHVDNTCAGQAAVFISQSSISTGSIIQYQWDFENDLVFDDLGDTVYFTMGLASTTYVTLLMAESDLGCFAFATKTEEVYDQPTASFAVPGSACAGTSLWFANGTTLNNDTISYYLWDFGDGTQDVNTGTGMGHTYNAGGNYNAQLIAVTENNCKDTTAAVITVYNTPDVSIDVTGDTVLYEGTSTTLTAVSTAPGTTFEWSNAEMSESILATVSGTYAVTVTDANTCSASAEQDIVFNPLGVPAELESNILTPNDDGYNDYLSIKDRDGYGTCSVVIYNRWNQKVYENADYRNDWNGADQDPGAYFYVLQCDDQEKVLGTINIIK